MYYDDLLLVKYEDGGRSMDGMDCYGFLLECLRREGKYLRDFAATPEGDLAAYLSFLNANQIPEYAPGCCAQFILNGKLHVGYMLNKRDVLHMTYGGARITPIVAMKGAKFFEVIND